jgi:hypothetical protein
MIMKLVIETQYRENYGAFDWDGEGECPQYWKCKGGSTYVINNISPTRAIKIGEAGGIPTITSLIESKSYASEEYIIDWRIVDNDAKICEVWEYPTELFWGGDRWLARRTQENDEFYGYMRRGVLRKREEWVPIEGGERANYKSLFDMNDGTSVSYADLANWFEQKEVA